MAHWLAIRQTVHGKGDWFDKIPFDAVEDKIG